MKQKLLFFVLVFSLVFGGLFVGRAVYAVTPNLTATQSGNTATLSINNADAKALVNLYQRQSSQLWSVTNGIGQTDANGNLSTTLTLAWDGSSNPLQMYVVVDNFQSSIVQLYQNGNGGTSSGTLSLSQTSLNLTSGQSGVVSAYPSSGSVYVASNSNSSVVSYNLSGNQLTIYGNQTGSSTLNVCSSVAGVCSNIFVTVNGGNGTGLSITPGTLNIGAGQVSIATVSGASGSLYISTNSSPSTASAIINGQTITVSGLASGSDTLTICQNGYSGCANLVITVGTGSSATGLTFSSSNISLSPGQNQNVATVFSPNSGTSFYISSNSTPAVVTGSMNGSLLYLSALTVGNSTLIICQNGYSYCGSVYVTVGSLNGSISFSQNTVSLNPSQSASITVSGGTGGYVISSNSNTSVATASLSGNILTISALSNGLSTLTICMNASTTACNTVAVTVGSGTVAGSVTFSSNSPVLSLGQNLTVSVYSNNGYTGSYTVTNNSNSSVVTATMNSSTLSLTGAAPGSTFLTICQSGNSVCGGLSVSVNNSITVVTNGPVNFYTSSLPLFTPGQSYSYQLQATGGTGTYSYSITSGSLPSGFTLSKLGLISGVPANSNSATFSIMVVDSAGTGTAATFTLSSNSSTASPGVVSTPVSPSPVSPAAQKYSSGQLINENGTVSIVYKNTKTGFASASAFTGLGFSFSNIISVTNSGLANSGSIVSTAMAAHPKGSWVLNKSTVYFVADGGLVPIPDWNTLINNGGKASFIVKANSYDMALAKLSVMTSGDSRVK